MSFIMFLSLKELHPTLPLYDKGTEDRLNIHLKSTRDMKVLESNTQIVKNELILKMTPENRRKTFRN